MAHHTSQSAIARLTERLNRFPQGAPPSELLTRILSVLFNEQDADLVAQLPIKPFTVATAAAAWKRPEAETRRILESLAERALLLDMMQPNGEMEYVLPPPMAGFFEFSLMRIRDDIDQKLLSELFHQYITTEEDFMRELLAEGETHMGRAFVDETVLTPDQSLHVLDYERASEVARTATHRGISMCYCRHKNMHLGRACDAPMDICMTFNGSAESLIRHGHAREVDVAECLDLLQQARELGLVQFGENVREGCNFICNCCGCCCEALVAARRFAVMHPIHTTNYIPEVDASLCTGCGRCVEACPVEAMALVSANDPARPKAKVALLDTERCLGCGVCVRPCAQNAITLTERAERVITPRNSVHKAVIMAVERGKLQELLFDNHALASHRAMAAVLRAILRLPPVKRAMASRQVRSRYLEAILARAGY